MYNQNMGKFDPDGLNKFGENADIDIAAAEDVWAGGGIYAFPTAVRIHNLVSTDTNDDGTSTGTLTLVSAVALTKASGTIQVASPVANTFATGTVTCASVLANTFATGTVTCASVVGEVPSSGTITVTSVTGEVHSFGTVELQLPSAADTVTINGLVYTAVTGVKADNTEFSIDTSTQAAAADLADSINNDGRAGTLNDVSATSAGDLVTCTQTVGGAGGDATTLAESTGGARIIISGATFTGGVTGDTVTVNGLVYTATVGPRANDTEFSVDTGDNETATDLAAAITADTRSGTLNDVIANSSTNVVTAEQTVGGTSGDATTLAESTAGARIVISGATFAGGVNGDTVTVNGLVYTATVGTKLNNTEFSVDTSDNACATDLADSITNDARAGTTGDQTASATTNVVTITTDVLGTGGNAITLVSSNGTRLAVSGAGTFTGGVSADTATVNGLVYTAVAGVKADNTEFSIDTGDNETATDLADSITNDSRSGTSGDQTASATTNVVTITTDVLGTGGNAITLASSDAGRLALSGATFSGGVAADTVTINGLVYTAVAGAKADDTEFSIDGSDDATATDLADSIDDDTRSGTLNDLTATATTDTVTAVQTVGGTGGNATTLTSSSTGVRLITSGATFTGGLQPDTATVNGLVYTAVAGVKANNTQFSIDTSDNAAAADLADSISNDTRTPITVPTAVLVVTSATNVVTINVIGTIGDLVDIAGTANITASGATLTDVGTGARTVEVQGLDANYVEISETVNLNGTTNVPTTKSYLRINRMIVKSAGSGGVNAGTITATAVTDATVTAQIAIGRNQSTQAIYTLPANADLSLNSYHIGIGKTTVSSVDGSLLVRPFGEVFQTKHIIGVGTNGSTENVHEFNPPILITAKSDIKVQASVSVNDTSVFGGFDGNFSRPQTV